VVLLDSKADGDCAIELICDEVTPPKPPTPPPCMDQTMAADDCKPDRCGRDAAAGSGNGCDHCDCAIAGSGRVDIMMLIPVITGSLHDEGEIKLEGAVGSGRVDVQVEGPGGEAAGARLPIPAAAALSNIAEGAGSYDYSRSCQSLLRGLSAADKFESSGATDAEPPAPAVVLRCNTSTFGMLDSDGTGDFEGMAGVEERAYTGESRADSEQGTSAAAAVDTAALFALYLRRVQPCRVSLDRRAKSAGAALLRSDLGSALFTRFEALSGKPAGMLRIFQCASPHNPHSYSHWWRGYAASW
jgi:hypothetical protein